METTHLFCEKCGAANPANRTGTENCFACGKPLLAETAQPELHPSTGPLIPGSLLNLRYLIIGQVGTGGFGAVYKAKDTQSGDRLVAIKEINLQGLKPQEVIEATDTFNREVMLLSGLAHPNLPKLYDHFTDPQHWYLVMDFIEGETLEEYLQKTRDGCLPLHNVLDIAIQLCTVLDYLHTRQPAIIFRDVKPANIMRTPRGHLYLIDFGTARHLKPGQARDTIALGSPGYAAPEQYGKAQTTQQSDIYSLGVTLHQLLTGNDPSENPFRLAALRATHASLPAELEALVAQMLDLDTRKRPASMAIVKQELEQIAFQQSRALYALQPSTTSNQVAPSTQGASGVTTRKGIFLPWAAIISKRLIINVILTGLALLLVVGSCSFFTSFMRFRAGCSCAPSGPLPAPFSQQIYRSPLVGITDSTVLDPALAGDIQSINATNMVYTGLMTLDDSLMVEPQLATTYSVSADGLHWTFHLRPHLKFSDGTPLTSADVAFSIDRALQPAEKSTVGPIYLALIKDSDKLVAGKIKTIIGDSIMTPDPSTVVLIANKKASYFLDALTYSCSYVVEKSLIDKFGNTKFTDHLTEGGGDGPFKVASYTHGQNIIFVPNPNYYGPIPQLAKVVYPFYKDADTVYKAYQVGQVDSTGIPSANLAAARKLTNEFKQVPQLWIQYYAMNFLVKPFDNIKIRQAFELAINKDLIVQSVWKNALIPTNHIVPKGQPGYTPNLTGPDGVASTAGDPTKAKALFTAGLQEEGMTLSTVPPIRLTYPSGSKDSDNEVAALQQMWQNVLGVSVKADPIDFNKLLSEITAATNNPKGLQFWGIGWIADYPDPQDWTTLQFDKGVPNNTMNYCQNNTSDAAQQQLVQQQLEAADINPDQNARLQAYMQAEQQLVNDVAWLPMEQVANNFLRKPCMAGVVDNPQDLTPPDDWGNIYKTTATQCADTSSFQ